MGFFVIFVLAFVAYRKRGSLSTLMGLANRALQTASADFKELIFGPQLLE
jgi:hypothetical protein